MHMSVGFLILEDGRVFKGRPIGDWRAVTGEVVFNTSMTGYQEILTDPSYAEQILTLTYPLVGNYGISLEFAESSQVHAAGLIVAEDCSTPSHWKSTTTLRHYLKEQGVPGLADVDTRALTRHIRTHGTLCGMFADNLLELQDTIKRLQAHRPTPEVTHQVSTTKAYCYNSSGSWRVAVVDFGVKTNILRSLASLDAEVLVFPGRSTAEEILSCAPKAVVLSNGPGDPNDCVKAAAETKKLMSHVPLMGICLGHQIIALAAKGETYKLKFGHRGGNHPVKDLAAGTVYMTAQNHGYAVKATPKSDFDVTHINVNDGSIEGLRHRELPIFSVQFHPEAAPGPVEAFQLFNKLKLMSKV